MDDKTFATDYCGFMNEDDILVVKHLLEYLGYEVELIDPVCEDEDCDGDCGY